MEEKIIDILVELTGEDGVREDLKIDLIEAGLLDSLAIVSLIVELEEAFDIHISPSEYEREAFSSVQNIMKLVHEKTLS